MNIRDVAFTAGAAAVLAGGLLFSNVNTPQASASYGVSPVCYEKTVVVYRSSTVTQTVHNTVAEQRYLATPRTKMCRVVQTIDIVRRFNFDDHKTVYNGWITVKY